MLIRMLKTPILIFGVSLLLQVTVILALGHYKHPVLWENGKLAQRLFDGKGFSFNFVGNSEATSWQAPGYPFLLAGIWKLLGQTPSALFILNLVQAILVSSIVFPVGWLTSRWFGPHPAAIARWVVCLMPLYAWYTTRFHQPAINIFFQPWLLAGWLKLYDSKSWRIAIPTGLATGLAALFQPVVLGVMGLISAALAVRLAVQRQVKGLLWVILAGACTLLTIAPWTVRNYQVHGRFVPIKSNFGLQFWMGNSPHATGAAMVERGMKDIFQAHPPASEELMGKVSEVEFMDAMKAEAWTYIDQSPGIFVLQTLKKAFWFWTAVPKKYLRSYGDGEAVRFWWLHTGYWFGFLLLMLIGRLGWGRFSKEYMSVLAVYFVFYSIVYGVTIVGNARFRGEMEFIFIPAVAAGFLSLLSRIQGIKPRRNYCRI